ncbi:MAG: DUF1858 domain-containing protein [Dehalococcoidales bacterium]|nr:DUF1858 domain-containing protein [Dehalococcoidales bacterium]
MKKIDLNKSLFDITEEYPELIPVLAELGFAGVTNEAMRTSHGKVMTILKGCEHLGIDLGTVKSALAKHGFSPKS